MANYRNDFADVNLETGAICRNFMNHTIGSGDALGDRFGVRVFRNGEPVSLGGTCAGYFVRNTTGETVVISGGVVSGNEAYVTLPAACYAVEGSFTLAIKVTSGSETVTMRIIDGVVSRTNTSVTVDPGTLVPSIETLISAINSAVGQIPVNYNASFAPAYSESSTYAVGDYVVYDGYLWRCTTAITETETWTAAHWKKVALASDVSDLKSAITQELIPTTKTVWVSGVFTPSGAEYPDSNFIRNGSKQGVANGVFSISVKSGYKLRIYAYNSSDTCIGTLKTDGTFNTTAGDYAVVNEFFCTKFPDYKFTVALKRDPVSSDITTSEGENVKYNRFTDETLTMAYKVPDAQVTGVSINKRDNVFRAYISGNQAPVFEWESTKLKITFPSSGSLYLFNPKNGNLYTITCSGQTYSIGGANTLRYNRTDGNMYILADSYTDNNTLVLLSVSMGGIDGILAPFYYEQMIKEAYLTGQAYAYFSGPSTPSFAMASDKLSINITMPTAELRIFTGHGRFKAIGVSGQTYTVERAGGRLIYDLIDSTIKVVNSATNDSKYSILLLSYNYYGFDGLLANYVSNILNNDYKDDIFPVVWKRNNGQLAKADFACVFITDIHAQAAKAKRAVEFANAVLDSPISCVINGGDTVALHQEDGVTWWNTIVGNSSLPVLSAVGNHDASISDQEIATAKQTYDLITAEVASTASITQPTGASTDGLNYYYKDFNSKVRVIVLDPLYWTEDENTWLQSTLSAAKTSGLAVLCVSHYPFDSAYMTFPELKRNYDAIYGADHTPIAAAEAVKAFMDDGGTFLCWLCGHVHCDGFGILEEYGNQCVILTTTPKTDGGSSPYKSNFVNEPNYDAFDVIGIDLNKKLIKDVRIGANLDWHNSRHPRITYNYDTHKIIEG